MGISGADNDPGQERHAPAPTTRDAFTATLNGLKSSSSFSYQALSGVIDRPVSTVRGWCTGRHLPYPRDNEVFEHLLRTFGTMASDTASVILCHRVDTALLLLQWTHMDT